jgi:hypothetical protein
MEHKVCLTCCKELPIASFSKRSIKRKNDFQPHCKICRSAKRREVARRNKALAIKYKGGKCNDCLTVVHQAAFEFHHTDPSTKADKEPTHFLNDGVNGISDSAKQELDKCVLLCANCHRIRHFSDLI